jgi:hypothetical protein
MNKFYCLVLIALILGLGLLAHASVNVTKDAEITADNFGGCHGFGQDAQIARLAARAALLKVLEQNPECVLPIFRSYRVLEQHRLAPCGWGEALQIKVRAEFDCLAIP